jgi:arylsulfatase
VIHEIVHHMDWLPTFLDAAGEPNIKEKLKKGGYQAIGRTYKVHLDGYDILPSSRGRSTRAPATRSSTSRTTAISRRSDTTTGS